MKTDWPNYDISSQPYMEIDLKTGVMKGFLRDKSCTFWNDVYPGLMRTHMGRRGYHPRVCPHMEFDLYHVEGLSNFIHGSKSKILFSPLQILIGQMDKQYTLPWSQCIREHSFGLK